MVNAYALAATAEPSGTGGQQVVEEIEDGHASELNERTLDEAAILKLQASGAIFLGEGPL